MQLPEKLSSGSYLPAFHWNAVERTRNGGGTEVERSRASDLDMLSQWPSTSLLKNLDYFFFMSTFT